MLSLRLDPELEERLRRAAAVKGETVSEFIRKAAAERADGVLEDDPLADWSDVIGVVHLGGGVAERTSDAYYESLVEAHKVQHESAPPSRRRA